MVKNNSLSVFAGQITGVFGLVGSGRTETFKIVAGVIKTGFLSRRRGAAARQTGAITACRGRRLARHRYVTEDRKIEGFFETIPIGGMSILACWRNARETQASVEA